MKPRVIHGVYLSVVASLIVVTAAICLGQEKAFAPFPSGSPAQGLDAFELCGAVLNATPDISDEAFEHLERTLKQQYEEYMRLGATEEERLTRYYENLEKVEKDAAAISAEEGAKKALGIAGFDPWMSIFEPTPASNAVVTLRGDSVEQRVPTDAEGMFRFVGITGGEYELGAEAPSGLPSQVIARGRMRWSFVPGSWEEPEIDIHAYLVNVEGRITTADGLPLAGAKVASCPAFLMDVLYGAPKRSDRLIEERRRYEISTVSAADGSYELRGFLPPHIWLIRGYLNSGTRDLLGEVSSGDEMLVHFFADIQVTADGYVQRNAPKVPLVTEPLLGAARRLTKLLIEYSPKLPGEEQKEYEEIGQVPVSEGTTITGIDIVMDPVADTAGESESAVPAEAEVEAKPR